MPVRDTPVDLLPRSDEASHADVPKLPALHAIVDVECAARSGWTPVNLAAACLDGGARLIQVRGKRLTSAELLSLSDQIVRLADRYGALVVVNDRVDVARLSGASGVHVGQEDLTPRAARDLLGCSAVVGLSSHTVEQVVEACSESLSYLAVGPVFDTASKVTGYDAVGLALVSEARRRVPVTMPIVAIGGVTLERVADVLLAGAHAVAVISDLLEGADPGRRVRAYHDVLASAKRM